MEYTIQKGNMTLTADNEGAELHGLTLNGQPMLWDAKPEIWGRHAPVCFPWCGDMDGWFEDEGKQYPDSNLRHGFVRTLDHPMVEQSEGTLTFRVDWKADNRLWPWDFSFETHHQIADDHYRTTCTAVNRSDRPMPIQFGYHPAFRCPFMENTALEDYQVRFENGTVVALHDHLFDMDSMCFPLPGNWAMLEHRDTGKGLKVDTTGYDFVLLWSKPGRTGFVCIEPWQGYPGKGHDLMKRPKARLLAPGESRSWNLDVTFHM